MTNWGKPFPSLSVLSQSVKTNLALICEICGRDITGVHIYSGGLKSQSVACLDHCHEHGDERGFLCRPCNSRLRFWVKKAGVLGKKARIYLKKHGCNSTKLS